MRLITLAVAAVVALTGTGWFADTANAAPQAVAVEMTNFAFSPAAVNVHTGDTVTWTNHDTAPHDVTVTSGPVAVHSPLLSTGQTWSYTFTTPGTYDYICSIHPDMHAVVTVAAAPAQPQRPASVVTVPAVATPQVASRTTMHMPSRAAVAATARSRAVPSPAATTSSAPAPAVVPASSAVATVSHPLKPLLIVAGLVAAVATFCLLVLASRPDEEPVDGRPDG